MTTNELKRNEFYAAFDCLIGIRDPETSSGWQSLPFETASFFVENFIGNRSMGDNETRLM